jgi:hypothetical protein
MDSAVGLVKSYLELCGYFVLAELPVRRADSHGYRDVTDLDIIAVRFPHPPQSLPAQVTRPLDVFLGLDEALGAFESGVDLIIGEVKSARSRVNPALRRAETIAFALRRVGCCPEEEVLEVAQAIARGGTPLMKMRGGFACRTRVVVFGGWGIATEPGVLTVPLSRCLDFIAWRLSEAHDVLAGAQFKDPVLGLLALQHKVTSGAPALSLEAVHARLPW